MEYNKSISRQISFCAIITTLAVMNMFISVIPGLVYLSPALSGILIWVVFYEISLKWAVLSYAASSLIVLMIIPSMESVIFFILLFGYYPMVKQALNKISFCPLRLLIKLLIFNITTVAVYKFAVMLLGSQAVLEGLEMFGQYAVYILLLIANFAFILYDATLKNIFYLYKKMIKPKIKL